jgi:hypothetical protein
MNNQEFDLIGVEAAAGFLGCCRQTLSAKVRAGYFKEGTHYTKGITQLLFSSKALTEWLKIPSAKRKVKP